MDFFESLANNIPIISPNVWISRFVIFSKVYPQPEMIQDISLHRGLNIIWAEDVEDDNPEAKVTGHSAGKTTCCRFIRYLLGEKSFGKKRNTDQIKEVFPNGYVAAELNIYDEIEDKTNSWAVMRPIGKNRNSYVLKNVTIETLLEKRINTVSQELYTQKLGLDVLLNQMETATIVRTDEGIQWGHLLSWCTRDQENRFQNVHEWRSPRSEHTSPSFKFPKEGPLFVMRTALGLFLPDELKGEEDISRMYKEKDRLDKKLDHLKQEPLFRKNLYHDKVLEHIQKVLKEAIPKNFPEFDQQPTIFPETLEGFVKKAIKNLEAEINEISSKIEPIEYEKDTLGADIIHIEQELEKVETSFELKNGIKKELDAGSIKKKDLMDKVRLSECYAGILHNDCEKFNNLYDSLKLNDAIDARFSKAKQDQIQEEIMCLENEKNDLKEKDSALQEKLSEIKNELNTLKTIEGDKKTFLITMKNDWNEFIQWSKTFKDQESFPELKATAKRIADLETLITSEETILSDLINKHDQNRDLLSQIFSQSVKTVLASDTYDGRFDMNHKELMFQITHGPAMSGEAIETLSVLLADISCQIFNAVSNTSALPGFLLHDSPREADLGLRIYLSFIRFVEKLHTVFGGENGCPFQYILTTTTAPPSELKDTKRVKLHLNAASEEGLLLKKDIFSGNEIIQQETQLELIRDN